MVWMLISSCWVWQHMKAIFMFFVKRWLIPNIKLPVVIFAEPKVIRTIMMIVNNINNIIEQINVQESQIVLVEHSLAVVITCINTFKSCTSLSCESTCRKNSAHWNITFPSLTTLRILSMISSSFASWWEMTSFPTFLVWIFVKED